MIHILELKFIFIKTSEFLKTVSFQLIKFKFMEITSMENNESEVDLSQDVDNAIIKSKLISGEYKLSLKRKKSKVWDTFGMIENSNGVLITNIVACKICLNIYKYVKSTSNLCRHKCYKIVSTKRDNEEVDVDLETKKKCTKIITEWSVLNCRPFTTTAYAELKKLASFFVSVGVSFGTNVKIETLLPNPTTVSININHLYEFHTDEIKYEISKIKCNGYGLTSGMWTDNYIDSTFISVTIHYICEGKIASRLLAMRSMTGDACTDADIKKTFSNVLEEFGCELEEDNPIIVTDRGCNMFSAFHSNNNVYCINHLINNIVEQTIGSVPELTTLITDCRNLVKYFKKSGINSNMDTSLEILCPTGWNTIFYLLQSVEKNWYEINNILKEKGELDRIQFINFNNLRSITSLLKTFENSSKTLEAHNISTLHLVIPHIHRLKIVCVKKYDDTDIVKRAKASFLELLQTVVYQNLTIFHKVALFLFPPTNKLTQYSEKEKEEIMEACKHITKSLFKTIPDSNLNDTLQQCPNNDIFADFVEKHQHDNLDTRIANEIQAYKNVSILITDKFDAVQWWNAHESQFPHLFKASCKILATPASSAPSERAFSAARQLITEKRCSVLNNLDLVDKIMFLHSNISEIDDNVLKNK